jgi:hypothetical protein
MSGEKNYNGVQRDNIQQWQTVRGKVREEEKMGNKKEQKRKKEGILNYVIKPRRNTVQKKIVVNY